MPLEFSRYSDIENSYRIKYVNDIIEYGLAYGNWSVGEKGDGCQFSFYVSKSLIKCAKRSGFINPNEKFYGYENVLELYNKNLCVLFKMLSELYSIPEDKLEYNLCGELLGGIYNHQDVPKSKIATKVQNRVYYSPDNDFYAFDLKVNESFVNYQIFEELMESCGFLWAKSLYIGDFKSCLEYPNSFQTKIPEWLELPPIENNICEGVVIKPLDARFFPSGDRVILKNKNEKFSEKNGPKHKKVNYSLEEIAELSEASKAISDKALCYITENRLRSVISKIGEINNKSFGKLVGLFTKDTIDDFRKDCEDEISGIEKEQMQLIQGNIKKNCEELVRKQFVNILDNSF